MASLDAAADASAEGSAEGSPVERSPGLHTTVAIALADSATTAELTSIIRASPDLELVATTSDAANVLEIAREFVPDVLVIGADLVMATMDDDDSAPAITRSEAADPTGALDPRGGPVTDLAAPVAIGLRALCGAVNRELPAVRLVVAAPEGMNSYGAVLGGAIGCIAPPDLVDRIVDSTRRVAWGEGLLTTEWARAVLADLGGRSNDRKEAGPLGRPVLTPTELEVLRRTAAGATASDIATNHGVPERDVNRGSASALAKARRLHEDRAIAEPPIDPDGADQAS